MPRHEDDNDLKGARGTLRADRQGKGVPFTPLEAMRKTPKGLHTRRAKFEWRRVTRTLIEDGLVAEADRSLLVAYCNEMARYHELSEELAEGRSMKAPVSKDDENRADRALKNAMKLGEMFGLTTLGRSKVKPGKAKQKEDPNSTESQFSKLKSA